jgi:hypothetical protein
MEKEVRQKIAATSRQIDSLEATLELIKTSNVLCFTTMSRNADETVSIEFTENNTNGANMVFKHARDEMVQYMESKIAELEKSLDFVEKKDTKFSKIQKKDVYLQRKTYGQ